jgi:hypothetical protein
VGDAAPPETTAAPAGSSIGSPHPAVLEAASPEKGWAVVCQARQDTDGDGKIAVRIAAHGKLTGDALSSYLVLGSGEGEPIDELAAYDPAGRWLVIRRAERLLLIDSASGTRSELAGADARPDRAPYRPHRTCSFDAAGRRLLWVKREGTRSRVIVRDLETAVEREIEPGPGELWRAELSADGGWALLSMITEDTNKNGRLDWPVPPGDNRWRCQGPTPSFAAWLGRGDAFSVHVAAATGGVVRPVPGLAVTLGTGLVVRGAAGQLFLQDAARPGPPLLLTSDKCGARVFAGDASRGLLLVACAGPAPAARPELALVGPGMRQLLGVRVAPFTHDREPGVSRRLEPIYSGRDTLLFDFEARRLLTLQPGDLVVDVRGSIALLRRNDRLVLFDAATGREQALPGVVESLLEPVTAGGASGVAAVAPWVVDLARGAVLGRFEGRALAVASDGAVLVAPGGDPSPAELAVGPLVWRAPLATGDAAAVSAASASPEVRPTSR